MQTTDSSPTGHHTFDKHLASNSGLIMTGNVISSTLYGFHVRARQDTWCNGFAFAPGVLQASDLALAQRGYAAFFQPALNFIAAANHFERDSGWCYIVRHPTNRRGAACSMVHGILVASIDNQLLRRFGRHDLGHNFSAKSEAVLDFAELKLAPNAKLAA